MCLTAILGILRIVLRKLNLPEELMVEGQRGIQPALYLLNKRLVTQKTVVFEFITKYHLTPISAGNDMVKGTRKMYACFSSHTLTLTRGNPKC
jgi:hypothetical protein